jgi:hypothetical protein
VDYNGLQGLELHGKSRIWGRHPRNFEHLPCGDEIDGHDPMRSLPPYRAKCVTLAIIAHTKKGSGFVHGEQDGMALPADDTDQYQQALSEINKL